MVKGNIYLSLEDHYKLDVYVEHIGIMFKTIGVVLFGEDKFKK